MSSKDKANQQNFIVLSAAKTYVYVLWINKYLVASFLNTGPSEGHQFYQSRDFEKVINMLYFEKYTFFSK